MSTYLTVEGYFVFLNENKYIEVRDKLLSGGFINENGDLLDEDNSVIEKKAAPAPIPNSIKFIRDLEVNKYIIKVPRYCYRNLRPYQIAELADYYWYVFTCTDGDFSASTRKHNISPLDVDLEVWAENKVDKVFDDEGLLENDSEIASEFLDRNSELILDYKIIKEATFYTEPLNTKNGIIIGEYKNNYLVDQPNIFETTLMKKEKHLNKGAKNGQSKKQTKKLITNNY